MKNTEILRIIGLIATASLMTGCMRSIDAWGLKVDFAEGMDLHAGFNGIDNVDDRRGINPKDKVIPLRKQITKEEY